MKTEGRTLLVIFPGDYDSSRAKGVDGQLLHFDEQGFFDRVVFVSPLLRRNQVIRLSARHEIREFGWGSGLVQRLTAPLHLLRVVAECVRMIKGEGVVLVRATEPTLSGLIAWAAARLTRIPYCVSLHADYDKLFALDGSRGAPTICGSRALVRPVERLVLRGAARVLSIRESLIPYAIARGVRPENVRVIPHGIDLSPFDAAPAVDVRALFDIPPGRAVVAFAGRLSPENYVGDLLDATARLAARRDDFVVVLAGGGPLEEEVATRMRRDPALARVVRPVGFVSQEIVRALRQTCAVSVCLMGGFSLIEACAGGRPVIAYDVAWHRELVIDGRTGRLIPEHDVDGVAHALADLLDDPVAAARMGAEGHALAVARHDIRVVSGIRRLWYEELLGA